MVQLLFGRRGDRTHWSFRVQPGCVGGDRVGGVGLCAVVIKRRSYPLALSCLESLIKIYHMRLSFPSS